MCFGLKPSFSAKFKFKCSFRGNDRFKTEFETELQRTFWINLSVIGSLSSIMYKKRIAHAKVRTEGE